MFSAKTTMDVEPTLGAATLCWWQKGTVSAPEQMITLDVAGGVCCWID